MSVFRVHPGIREDEPLGILIIRRQVLFFGFLDGYQQSDVINPYLIGEWEYRYDI